MNVVSVIFILTFFKGCLGAGPWGYEGSTGTDAWSGMYITCGGSRQSPINIETGNVKPEVWSPFEFLYYDATPTRMRIKNNGHSAQVEMDAPNAPRVKGGGLDGEYIFAQFHFHWGRVSTKGSEHTIDGVRYPMELHLVHYKAEYGSLSEAIKRPDGLAVLGILFEVGSTDSAAFDPIVRSLESIRNADAVADVSAKYPLSAYLPTDRDSYFRYMGSLTTPTCNEVVVWTVFRKPVSISENQLDMFRSLLDAGGHALVDNFRPPQQIRSRVVQVSTSECHDDGHWQYGDFGSCVSNWVEHAEVCASGSSQSPIDMDEEHITEEAFADFEFINYDKPMQANITNNGHSAQVQSLFSDYKIRGGGLTDTYVFAQFHFHWGANSVKGSEHTVGGRRFPLELHLVHYREAYGSLGEAVKHSDGLAVLGILFTVGDHDNPNLYPVVSNLKNIVSPNDKKAISMNELSAYLPRDSKTHFYRYQGSLTTPTCNEAVVWTVFKHPVSISESQMEEFRKLESGHGQLVDNFRPLQKLHGRKIYKSITGSATSVQISLVTIITAITSMRLFQ